METRKVLNLLSDEVNEKIFNNTIRDFGGDNPTPAIKFYDYKLNRKFDKHGLCGFFVFDRTPEGYDYWNELSEALVKVVFTK